MLQRCDRGVIGVLCVCKALEGQREVELRHLRCYKGVKKVLQGCYKSVTRVWQGCYKSITRV
jgi:hypothetical protein